jgi:hypothetical protein
LENSQLPKEFILYQNYPNPFNSQTRISFYLPKLQKVALKIYNILGSEIATLVDEELTRGVYNYIFDVSNLTSGVYFYQLQANGFLQTRKLMVLK